jgi:predicted phage-related endonuclease
MVLPDDALSCRYRQKEGYLAVLVASRDFYWFELERDEAEVEALMASEQDFWWCVDTDTPPDTDGSEATTEALETIYAEGFGEDTASLFGRESLLAERSQLKAQQKALDERVKEIDNRIKADMGHAEKAACGRFSVSWKSQSRRTFQEKDFRKDHPDIDLDPYYKVSNNRVFKVTEKEAV